MIGVGRRPSICQWSNYRGVVCYWNVIPSSSFFSFSPEAMNLISISRKFRMQSSTPASLLPPCSILMESEPAPKPPFRLLHRPLWRQLCLGPAPPPAGHLPAIWTGSGASCLSEPELACSSPSGLGDVDGCSASSSCRDLSNNPGGGDEVYTPISTRCGGGGSGVEELSIAVAVNCEIDSWYDRGGKSLGGRKRSLPFC